MNRILKKGVWTAAAASLFLFVASPVLADDGDQKDAKLPKSVASSVHSIFPKAKVIGVEKEDEDGAVVYEITLSYKAGTLVASFTKKGKVVKVEMKDGAKKAKKGEDGEEHDKAKTKKGKKDDDDDKDVKGKEDGAKKAKKGEDGEEHDKAKTKKGKKDDDDDKDVKGKDENEKKDKNKSKKKKDD
ncbi:MAG TPA: hypothetical protein VGJ05_11835 [Fimbriiglobus sp.]|jgi:hypothetical protein